LAAIAFGAISIILAGGFFEDTFLRMREAVIHSQYGHIQLYSKGFREKGISAPYDYMIQNPEALINQISELDHVVLVTPRLPFSGMLSTGENTMAVFCQGIDPGKETRLSILDHVKGGISGIAFDQGKNLDKKDTYSLVMGRGLAKNLGAASGDDLVLLTNTTEGALNAFDFKVKGIFLTASKEFDDRAIRLPITVSKRLLRTEDVQSLVILLDKTENTDQMILEIDKFIKDNGLELEIVPWTELADFYNKTVELYGRQFLVLKIIILIIVVLSIFNTINMAIWERTREIGTIMAIGYKQLEVLQLFLVEGLVLGISGGIIGVLSGICLAWGISFVGIPMPPPPGATVGWTAMIEIVPHLLVTSFFLAIFAALISSFYPAFKASRMMITDALRHY
jgi:putative ABC transport system permease protein